MIISKRILIESVIRELNVNDVLSPEWQDQANDEMDTEFYGEKAEVFWRMMHKALTVRRDVPQHINLGWIRRKISDMDVYKTIKQYGFDAYNEKQMYDLAKIELDYLM